MKKYIWVERLRNVVDEDWEEEMSMKFLKNLKGESGQRTPHQLMHRDLQGVPKLALLQLPTNIKQSIQLEQAVLLPVPCVTPV